MSYDTAISAVIYKQADSLVSREIAGEMLLVPLQNNIGDLESIYTLNETGAYIWANLDGSHTLKDVCAGLVSEYDVPEESAWEDVIYFVNSLLSISALVEVK